MYAFIIKEFRQNGLWALIASVLMSIVLVFILYLNRSQSESLADSSMMLTQGLLFGNGGLALGIAMILTDTYRGRWGFIVTRPISRTQIFFSKLIAGSILYFAATSFSIAKLTIFAMNMRFSMAPFSWDMLIPSIYIQFVGWSGMVGGMLLASRRASWIGSRLFPAAAIFIANMLVISALIYFGESLFALLILIALFIFAGLAYFIHNGEYEPQPKWIKPVQFVIVAAGSGMLVAAACGIVYLMQSLILEPTEYHFGTQYAFTSDGTAYRWKYSKTLQPVYFDINDNPVGSEKSLQINNDRMPMGYHYWYDENDTRIPRGIRLYRDRFINGRTYLQTLFLEREGDKWIYVAGKRIIQGIDSKGNSLGVFGADGWHENAADAKPLEGRLIDVAYRGVLATDREVFSINANNRTIKFIYRAEAGETIKTVSGFAANRGRDQKINDVVSHEPYLPSDFGFPNASIDYVTIVTNKNLKILSDKGPVLSFNIEKYNLHHVNVGGGMDGSFYLHFGVDNHDPKSTEQLVKINSAGEVLSTIELPSLYDVQTSKERTGDWIPMTSIPSALFLIAWVFGEELTMVGLELPVYICCLLIALALTALLARRYQFTRSQTIIWMLATLAFGITTVLTLIFLRNKPAKITCPNCGNKRTITSDPCPNCSKILSPSTDPEIEIFDLPLKIA